MHTESGYDHVLVKIALKDIIGVYVRNAWTCKNFCESLLEPKKGYAWKRHLHRLTKLFGRMTICSLFMHLRLRRERKDYYMKVGEARQGMDYHMV